MVHFDSAVRLNPTMDHVTSRLRCMADVRPDQVLEEALRIKKGELPNDLPLLNLIYGAATAAGKVKDPEELVQLYDVVARLLRYMTLEDYFPMDRTITELKTGRKFDAFRRRPGALQLLERMRQRNEQLTSPIRQSLIRRSHPPRESLPGLDRGATSDTSARRDDYCITLESSPTLFRRPTSKKQRLKNECRTQNLQSRFAASQMTSPNDDRLCIGLQSPICNTQPSSTAPEFPVYGSLSRFSFSA